MKLNLNNPIDQSKAVILEKLNKIAKPVDLDEWLESIKKWDKIIKDYDKTSNTRQSKQKEG